MAPYLNALPVEQWEHVLCLSADGLEVAKQISYTKHTLESTDETLMTAVALWRHSWLHTTSLPFDI